MIHPRRIREFLAECMASIEEINRVEFLVDDNDINKITKEHTYTQNHLLIGFLPDYNTSGTKDVDALYQNTHLGFMVLEKINYRNLKGTEGYADVFINSFSIVEEFIEKLLLGISGEGDYCDVFMNADPGSIHIEPVKRQDECNGWLIVVTVND